MPVEGDGGMSTQQHEWQFERADGIPVVFTPAGGWTGEMPPPILAGCAEPLVDGAPDMRGIWRIVEIQVDGRGDQSHRVLASLQRIEQCGDRVVITAGGIIHDMRADGTEANGVQDVAEFEDSTPISVVATFENGVHVLRPRGMPFEVRRRIEGDHLVWDSFGFTAHLERID